VSYLEFRNVQPRLHDAASKACRRLIGRIRLLLRRSPVPPGGPPRSAIRTTRGANLLSTGFRIFRAAECGCAANIWAARRSAVTFRRLVITSPTPSCDSTVVRYYDINISPTPIFATLPEDNVHGTRTVVLTRKTIEQAAEVKYATSGAEAVLLATRR